MKLKIKNMTPAQKMFKKVIIDGEEKEGYFIPQEFLNDFVGNVYTETEWYPDYVAKGESKQSDETKLHFIRGWVARELWNDSNGI